MIYHYYAQEVKTCGAICHLRGAVEAEINSAKDYVLVTKEAISNMDTATGSKVILINFTPLN